MTDIRRKLHSAIEQGLQADGYGVIDVTPVPAQGSAILRIQTLEDVIRDFEEGSSGDGETYVIHVRRNSEAPQAVSPSSALTGDTDLYTHLVNETYQEARQVAKETDGIYLPTGDLNVSFLWENGKLLFEAGEYSLARNIFESILKTGSATGEAFFWLGRTHEKESAEEPAIDAYRRSLCYEPSARTYRSLAALLIRRGNHAEGADALVRCSEIKGLTQSARADLLKSAGNCYLRATQTPRAIECYQSALALQPQSDEIAVHLGSTYLQNAQLVEAKKHFLDALARNARNDKALTGLGSCYRAEGDLRQAHDRFAEALSINVNNPSALFYLVKCAYAIKSYATAARILEHYIDAAPINANLLYTLAGLQYHLGRIEDATRTLDRLFGISPDHAPGLELRKLIAKINAVMEDRWVQREIFYKEN